MVLQVIDVDLARDPDKRLGLELRRHFLLLICSHVDVLLFTDLTIIFLFDRQIVALQQVILVRDLVHLLFLFELVRGRHDIDEAAAICITFVIDKVLALVLVGLDDDRALLLLTLAFQNQLEVDFGCKLNFQVVSLLSSDNLLELVLRT